METNPRFYYRRQDEQFFRKKHISTVSFALALVLFLLPFAEIRCGPMTVINNTGIGLATGQEWKVAMFGRKMMKELESAPGKKEPENPLASGMNFFLLFAIAAGIFGLIVGLTPQSWKNLAGMCCGTIGFIMLIAVMIQLKSRLQSTIYNKEDWSGNEGLGGVITVRFTIWYYMSLIAFACAAFFSFKKYKLELGDELMHTTEFEFQQTKSAIRGDQEESEVRRGF